MNQTLVNGTAYAMTGGNVKVSGTVYSMQKGRCKVSGTVYEIPFTQTQQTCTVTIMTMDGMNFSHMAEIGGNLYVDNAVVEVPAGTRAMCSLICDYDDDRNGIFYNGEQVTYGSGQVSYEFTVHTDLRIMMMVNAGGTRIDIFEE